MKNLLSRKASLLFFSTRAFRTFFAPTQTALSALRSLLPAFLSSPKPRPQMPQLAQLDKLHLSDGCQVLRSRSKILPQSLDLAYGELPQFLLLSWLEIMSVSLANFSVRLFR